MKKERTFLLIGIILLSIFGLIMIYSASNVWSEYKFNDQYLDGASSTYIAENAAKKPYELDDLKYSDNYLGFLTKARINYSNKFGLITITSSSVLDDTSNREVILITASYLLDPIYDKIIY